jgi:glycosyltransferase involved in cell wall biosynthesis
MIQVSVIITNYNRAKLIQRALQSVLSQVRDFKIQLVIVDDGSTDNSVEVIRQEIRKHNNTNIYIDFFPLLHRGMMATYITAIQESKGKYLAFLDTDDYWIDPLKLKRQLDYMEANPDCGICFTRVAVNGKIPEHPEPIESLIKRITYDNLLRGNSVLFAQSYFIRRATFDKYIDFSWYRRMSVWDYPIVLELIHHTRFAYMDFYSAVFTIEGESVTNTHSRRKRLKLIWGYAKIKAFFIRKYGISFVSLLFLFYWFTRSVYSIIFKRWYK